VDTLESAPAEGTMPSPEPASLRVEPVEAVPLLTCLPLSAAPVTVAEVITLYLEHVQLRRQLRTLAPKTAERAKHYLTDFSRTYGAIGLTDCRSTDLTRWLLDRPQWRSASTKSDALTAVMTAFRWAVRERLIPYVPFIRPRGASVQPRPGRQSRNRNTGCSCTRHATCQASAAGRRPSRCVPQCSSSGAPGPAPARCVRSAGPKSGMAW
jgi:hypothetical protein